jgi:hypothetical protein
MASNSTLRNVESKAGIFPFLLLPAEIRLQIYGIMAIPDTDLVSSYKGLFLSCKQIKDEMEDEFTYVFGKYIQPLKSAMAAQLPGSSVQLVRERFSGSYRLEITLPSTSLPPGPTRDYDEYPDVLWTLVKLPLDLLSIDLTLSEDRSTLPEGLREADTMALWYAYYHIDSAMYEFRRRGHIKVYGPRTHSGDPIR